MLLVQWKLITKRSNKTKYITNRFLLSPNFICFVLSNNIDNSDITRYLIKQTKFLGPNDLVILSFPCIY